MARVVVLGAGFAGLSTVARLRALAPDDFDVTLVEPRSHFTMGLSFLWALDGRRRLEEGTREIRHAAHLGAVVRQGTVRRIELDERRVQVDEEWLPFDFLVVAMGAELDPRAIPGFHHAYNLYDPDAIPRLHDALDALPGGRIVVAVGAVPFKCPPAPYEAALLISDFLMRRGTRAKTSITLTTPEARPLPIAPGSCGDALLGLLTAADVEYRPAHTPLDVDAGRHEIRYHNGSKIGYDVLIGVPPHRAPTAVKDAGLADATGWVPVNPLTMRTSHSLVWAAGDVTAVPTANARHLPKSGVLAMSQGLAAAEDIVATATGRIPRRFDGRGECHVEVGGGRALRIAGDFFATPQPTVEMSVPTESELQDLYRFERQYLDQWFGNGATR